MNLYDLDTQTDESKFVPMVKKAVLAGETVKIHVKNKQSGMRQWMRGTDFAKRLLALLPQAESGKTYHLVGEELSNLT
jgi:dTDP-D-glucose 4,6-dehydratase